MPESSPDTSPHNNIVRELLHERSRVATPRVSPDGQRVSFVVSTIDVDENTTRTRVWLDGAPLTAGPYDGSPTWSPDGTRLAFTSRRGEKKGDSTLHVIPVAGPGEIRTVCTMPDGLSDVAWSPDGKWLAFTSRTRDERYEAKDLTWQSPRKIERFFSQPFHVAEIFTGSPGKYVTLKETIRGFKMICDGECDHLPEQAFYMVGGIEEALEKAKKLAA